MNSSYTKLAPATIKLLYEKAAEGYYITPNSNRGFSEFVNALSQVAYLCNEESITIHEPLGAPVLTSLTPSSVEAYTQIANAYLLPTTNDAPSVVLNNIPTNYLTPVQWPTMFPSHIMEHLPKIQPTKIPSSKYQRYTISTHALQNLTAQAGLVRPSPSKLSLFINTVLADPSRVYIDNRPPTLIEQSQTNALLGLPQVWFDHEQKADYRLHLQLSLDTMATLVQHAKRLQIQPRSSTHSDTATISAFLEAIGQDYLRWQ